MVTTSESAANLGDPVLPDTRGRIEAMEQLLGLRFRDRRLLLQSLLHRSAVLERQRDGATLPSLDSNERLEFLGDAVLTMLVAEYAYAAFPDYGEGQLTEVRAALVRRSTLGILADDLGIGSLLYVGRAERKPGTRGRMTVLAEAFEAIVAAIFLDQGLEVTRAFVAHMLDGRVPALLARAGALNAKSRLQELAQSRMRMMPVYDLLRRSGPAHDSRFTVEARVGEHVAVGEGTSKQGAEQSAANNLLAVIEPLVAGDEHAADPGSIVDEPGYER